METNLKLHAEGTVKAISNVVMMYARPESEFVSRANRMPTSSKNTKSMPPGRPLRQLNRANTGQDKMTELINAMKHGFLEDKSHSYGMLK